MKKARKMPAKSELEKIKEQLETESKSLEADIKSEYEMLKKGAQKTIRNSLLVAGGAVAAVALLKLVFSDKKKVPAKKEMNSTSSTVSPGMTSRIKSAVGVILLEVAKKKILEYLNEDPDDSKSTQ